MLTRRQEYDPVLSGGSSEEEALSGKNVGAPAKGGSSRRNKQTYISSVQLSSVVMQLQGPFEVITEYLCLDCT